MEYILAPWRKNYVKNVSKMKGCIFCKALEMENDRQAYILYRGKYNFILLNRYPYTSGHLMIAPHKHSSSLDQAEKESTYEFIDLLKLCLQILKQKFDPQGFNTGMNIGQSAGAGIPDHYHIHVIPRWTGDSNFLPLVSQTKVIMQDLNQTYDQLYPLFQKSV